MWSGQDLNLYESRPMLSSYCRSLLLGLSARYVYIPSPDYDIIQIIMFAMPADIPSATRIPSGDQPILLYCGFAITFKI